MRILETNLRHLSKLCKKNTKENQPRQSAVRREEISFCLPTVSWELSPSNSFYFFLGPEGGCLVSARNSRLLSHPLINETAFCREAPEVTACCLSNKALVSRCPTSPEQGQRGGNPVLFPRDQGRGASHSSALGGGAGQIPPRDPHPKDTLITLHPKDSYHVPSHHSACPILSYQQTGAFQ